MFLALGTTILLVGLWDAFITVFSTAGGGPITASMNRFVWKILLGIHRRRKIHTLLSFVGPFLLLANIVFWYVAQGLGWLFIFHEYAGSVVDNTTGEPAGLVQTMYFVGSTISSLGYGDYVPSGSPFTLIAIGSCFVATVFITVAVSYVLAVINAAIERKLLAQAVHCLGHEPLTVIENAQLGNERGSLVNQVLEIAASLDAHSHKHLAYPILHFFHSSAWEAAPAPAVKTLSDAFFLAQYSKRAELVPPRGLQHVVGCSIDTFLSLADARITLPETHVDDTREILDQCEAFGVAVDSEEMRAALPEYLERRACLRRQEGQDGW